jgi:LysM repeat protein
MSVPGWFGDPTHRVRAGDTLWDISQTYRVPLAALCEANELGAKAAGIKTRLRPGQDLLILPRRRWGQRRAWSESPGAYITASSRAILYRVSPVATGSA